MYSLACSITSFSFDPFALQTLILNKFYPKKEKGSTNNKGEKHIYENMHKGYEKPSGGVLIEMEVTVSSPVGTADD